MTTAAYHFDVARQDHRRLALSRWSILSIFFAAFVVRLLWMMYLRGPIDTEGAEYARIAENLLSGNGYRGIATEGTELMFPPLFPFLIAAFSLLTNDVQLAGRLVSLLMGTLLVPFVYLIAARMYGRGAACIAALLAAFHPLLVNLSV